MCIGGPSLPKPVVTQQPVQPIAPGVNIGNIKKPFGKPLLDTNVLTSTQGVATNQATLGQPNLLGINKSLTKV